MQGLEGTLDLLMLINFKNILCIILFLLNARSFAVERIISLSPSITEILSFIGAGPKVVGVSTYCREGNSLCSKRKVGTSLTPNYEAIISLKPSLILTQKIQDKTLLKTLEELKISYKELSFNTLKDIENSFDALRNVGTERVVSVFLKDIEKEYGLSKEIRLKEKTFFAFLGGEEKAELKNLTTIGRNTYLSELIELHGLKNHLKQDKAYSSVSQEFLIKSSPDIIFLFTENESLNEKVFESELVKKYQNLRNTKFIFIKGKEYLIPGPQILDLIKELRKSVKN